VEVISNGETSSHSVSDNALRGTDKLLGTGSGAEVISNGESWSPPMLDNAFKDSDKLLGAGPLDGGVDVISNGDTGDSMLHVMPDIDLRSTEKPVRTRLAGGGITGIGRKIPDPMSGAVLIDDEVVPTCKKASNTNCSDIIHDIEHLLKTSTDIALICAGVVGANISVDVKSMSATGNTAVADSNDLFALAASLQYAAHKVLHAAGIATS